MVKISWFKDLLIVIGLFVNFFLTFRLAANCEQVYERNGTA